MRLTLETKTAKKKQKKYPLIYFVVKNVVLFRLIVVNWKNYSVNYPYRSGITKDLKKNLEKISTTYQEV